MSSTDIQNLITIYRLLYFLKVGIRIACILGPILVMYQIFRRMVKQALEGKPPENTPMLIASSFSSALIITLLPNAMMSFFALTSKYDTTKFTTYYTEASLEKIETLQGQYEEALVQEKNTEVLELKEAEMKAAASDEAKKNSLIENENNKKNNDNNSTNQDVTQSDGSNNGETISGSSNNNDLSEDSLEIDFIASGFYDDAILLRTKTTTMFIDGGRYSAKKKVLPYLDKKGVTTIDALIGSHVEYDHITVQGAILENYNVKEIYYPDNNLTCLERGTCKAKDQMYVVDAIKAQNKTPNVVKPGNVVTVGDLTMYFLAPTTLTSTINKNSFVFILKYGEFTMMFTGDMPGSSFKIDEMQSYANQMGISLDIDILKYPHHGNNTLSEKLLNTIKPEYFIIPNYNAAKYPSSSNMARIKKYGKVYRQSDSSTGSLKIIATKDGQITITEG